MKKLWNILPSNLFFFFLVLICLLRITWKLQENYVSSSRLGFQTVEGIVRDIKRKGEEVQLTVNDVLIDVSDTSYSLGQKIKCVGVVEVPFSYHNFYLFDYQKYLASQRIFYQMEGTCEKLSSHQNFLYAMKESLLKFLEARSSRAYLKAFLLGDKGEIEEPVLESYQKNGILHLFSVSGMHLSFFFLLFSSSKQLRRKRDFLLLPIFLFYLFLTNFSPSLVRASLFFYFQKGTRFLRISPWKSFVLFTMLLLALHPYYLYHTGFLFSFTISFFLLFCSSFLQKKRGVLKLLYLSLICFLASFPIQVNTNFMVNFLSPIYNLLFIPFVSTFLFPFSLFTFFFPCLDSFYNFCISCLEEISLFLTHFPTKLSISHISNSGIVLYYLIFFFIAYQWERRKYGYSIGFLLFLLVHFLFPYLSSTGWMVVFDVGQGDSILLVSPYHKTSILLDTAGASYDTKITENILLPSLSAYGVSSLDFLILTHGDSDHMGESISLIEQFPVEHVILNCGEFNSLEQELIQTLEGKNIPYDSCPNQIDTGFFSLFFLRTKEYTNENDNSNVLYAKIHRYQFLWMGDASKTVEEEILKKYRLENIDVLKVGHHGSKTSSSPEFVNAIHPKYAVISVGNKNRYGHPHSETLETLKNAKVYRTDQNGSIRFQIEKNTLKVETYFP